MADNEKKFWRDYKSEFKKIVWPSKEETTKSTVVVVSTSSCLQSVLQFSTSSFPRVSPCSATSVDL